uniref:Uncharacterized protein n=1 Tax=Rhizophora mucronata TaxID=61149 RepID=A0A2P2MV85_RHIMU
MEKCIGFEVILCFCFYSSIWGKHFCFELL